MMKEDNSREHYEEVLKSGKFFEHYPAFKGNWEEDKGFWKFRIVRLETKEEEIPIVKPIHVKPAIYAHYYYDLKEIALKYGYNLVLHGSLNRDLDLIAIPWSKEIKPHLDMIEEFAIHLGGYMINEAEETREAFAKSHNGRRWYGINILRGEKSNNYIDPQYYLDISVTPAV